MVVPSTAPPSTSLTKAPRSADTRSPALAVSSSLIGVSVGVAGVLGDSGHDGQHHAARVGLVREEHRDAAVQQLPGVIGVPGDVVGRLTTSVALCLPAQPQGYL